MDGKCRGILVSSGAVAASVRIVDLGVQEDVRFIHAGTLLNLSYCEKYSDRMHRKCRNTDVVETLLRLSVSKFDNARIMCGAILCRLASDQSCAKEFVDLGLLQALITLVSWYDQMT